MKNIIIILAIVTTAFVGYYLLANASNPPCPCSQGR